MVRRPLCFIHNYSVSTPCEQRFNLCCVGIIFQTAAYGESLFLFRDVNHDSMTSVRVFMAVWLCRGIFVCVRSCVSVLVYVDAQWIAGSQGEGRDAFVAVGPHVVVVHLFHPHSRLVQDTCGTREACHTSMGLTTHPRCALTHTHIYTHYNMQINAWQYITHTFYFIYVLAMFLNIKMKFCLLSYVHIQYVQSHKIQIDTIIYSVLYSSQIWKWFCNSSMFKNIIK